MPELQLGMTRCPTSLFLKRRPERHGEVCFRTQSEMEFRASGAMVSSMPPYSVGEPVGAC
jgi:hypothetical protein